METFPLPHAQRKAADNGSCGELLLEHVSPGSSRLRGHCRRAPQHRDAAPIPSTAPVQLPAASLQLPADFNGATGLGSYLHPSLSVGQSLWIQTRNPDVQRWV